MISYYSDINDTNINKYYIKYFFEKYITNHIINTQMDEKTKEFYKEYNNTAKQYKLEKLKIDNDLNTLQEINT